MQAKKKHMKTPKQQQKIESRRDTEKNKNKRMKSGILDRKATQICVAWQITVFGEIKRGIHAPNQHDDFDLKLLSTTQNKPCIYIMYIMHLFAVSTQLVSLATV